MTVEGNATVGDFKYLPGENNSKVKPNQIRNTALGDVILEKNVDEYFEKVVFTESRFIGIKMAESKNVISGEINEFLIDDLGYSIDWTLDVTYTVTNGNGDVCYNENQKIEKNTAKFANAFGTLNEVMKLNVELVFADEKFAKCIAN